MSHEHSANELAGEASAEVRYNNGDFRMKDLTGMMAVHQLLKSVEEPCTIHRAALIWLTLKAEEQDEVMVAYDVIKELQTGTSTYWDAPSLFNAGVEHVQRAQLGS